MKKILNYQIIFNEQLSNYRKTRDTMSFMLFNRSEKEKEEREFPSELKSINSKLIELLSLDFMDEKGQNRFIFGSKNIYELYKIYSVFNKSKKDIFITFFYSFSFIWIFYNCISIANYSTISLCNFLKKF